MIAKETTFTTFACRIDENKKTGAAQKLTFQVFESNNGEALKAVAGTCVIEPSSDRPCLTYAPVAPVVRG